MTAVCDSNGGGGRGWLMQGGASLRVCVCVGGGGVLGG